MQHSRGRSRPAQLGGGDQPKGLSEAWTQLEKARKELRRMEHRLEEVQVAGEGVTAGASAAPFPDQTFLLHSHPPTARFVEVTSPSRSAPQGSSSKRKVSRLDEKSVKAQHRSAQSQPHCLPQPQSLPQTEPEARRVDFAQRLRLREVRWDGTYRDTVAGTSPQRLPGYMDAGPGLPPQHAAPAAPTQSAPLHAPWHQSAGDSSLQEQSTLTDSRALRETEIRFLNNTSDVTESRRPRHPDRFLERHPQQQPRSPRLTHVDLQVPGGARTLDVFPAHRPLPYPEQARTAQQRGRGGGGGERMERPRSALELAEGGVGVGGGGGGGEAPARERSRSTSESRMQKIKRTLKELPNDDRLLSQLREKIRHQRLSASSTDNSHNESLNSSLSLDHARELTPQHLLHDQWGALGASYEGSQAPDRPPRMRKVTAGPPPPTYRGFSELHLDPALQNQISMVGRLTQPKTKVTPTSLRLGDTAPASSQYQPKAHNSAAVSSVLPSSTSTPNAKEKPRKTARVVSSASSSKRLSKPGAKNLITTSSWRAGQDLVARELGLPPPRVSHNKDDHRGVSHSDQRRPDGAEENLGSSGRVPAAGSDTATHLAHSRSLSRDAKKLLSDLQLDNKSEQVPSRPAVKRKAPKATDREADKPDPIEKQRHYDSEAVRQYMAKQKAERQRQREEARKEDERQMQKRQKLMQELISKQKMAVAATTAVAGGSDSAVVGKLKTVKRAGKRRTPRTLFPPDQPAIHEERIRALLANDLQQQEMWGQTHSMEVDDASSDADTLTGESEEGSTPRATPLNNARDDALERVQPTFDLLTDSNTRPRPAAQLSFHNTAHPSVLPATASTSSKTIEINGKKISLDVEAALSRFSQVVSQRQGTAAGLAESSSGSEGSERSRQERLLNLKEAARELQGKISLATAEVSSQSATAAGIPDQTRSPSPEFVPRYERIAGSREAFSVFTSNLPGTQHVTVRGTSSDLHSALGGGSATQSLRDSISSSGVPRLTGNILENLQQGADDDDNVTVTSTFSDVTAADIWNNEKPKKTTNAGAQEAGAVSTTLYQAPGRSLRWETPRSDPYSILNVFSRQQLHGLKSVGGPARREDDSQDHPKEPRLTSTQQVVFGHTQEGHPTMMRTTYTRLEAALPGEPKGRPYQAEPKSQTYQAEPRSQAYQAEPRSQASQATSHRGRPVVTGSEGSRIENVGQISSSRMRSTSEDTPSLESEEEATRKPASNRHTSKASAAYGYGRQISADTGQESDVSQLSEDEPRGSVKTFEHALLGPSQEEAGEARWSPAALERQMAAELQRLESLEDSLRQLSSADRTRAVALAQQETVSVAQVLKARQQAHSAELRSLQLQVQEERLLSARRLQEQLDSSKGVQAPASDMLSLAAGPAITNASKAEGASKGQLRSEARLSSSRFSRNYDHTQYSQTLASSRDSKSVASATAARSLADKTNSTPSVPTAEDSEALSPVSVKTAEDSVKTAEDSVKTAEDSEVDSDSSIQTASDVDRSRAGARSTTQVPSVEYSMSFEESSVTEEDEVHTKSERDAKRLKVSRGARNDSSSYRLSDLTSLYGVGESLNHFSIDIIRNIMREEEMRAQHQETLLKIRQRALKEKSQAQLSLIQQERSQVRDRAKGDEAKVQKELKRMTDREIAVKREYKDHKAEIAQMFRSEQLAREHRKSLLKQHEHIAKLQEETREKMQQLQGRLDQSAMDHTEDEGSMIEDLSDVSEASFAQGTKSREKQKLDKQQKLRLDHKYLTVREQKLKEREKQARELLKWRQNLDAQEEKVLRLEQHALKVWADKGDGNNATLSPVTPASKPADKKKEEADQKVKASGNLRPEPMGGKSDVVNTPRSLRTDVALTPRSAVDTYTPFSESQAVSTHISASQSEHNRSGTATVQDRSAGARARRSQDSGSSVPEDLPDGSCDVQQPSADTPEKQRLDTSDDTIINSSVNEEEDISVSEGMAARSGPRSSKSPVGRLLPLGSSPLPQPWGRRGGSESESEPESVSHAETQSDLSDYEVRIRQLSDMLRKRRKEVDLLKKERTKRMKEKLRAQEESLKKQLEAYEVYIAQVKAEQADLELDAGRPAVPPKIKQPHAAKTRSSPTSSPSPSRQGQNADDAYSSSFDGTDSNQTSPALSDKDSKLSPLAADKMKKKSISPSSMMDRISEGSESQSERSALQEARKERSVSEASMSEAIEEALDSVVSSSGQSVAFDLNKNPPTKIEEEHSEPVSLKRSEGAKPEAEQRPESVAEENLSYSQDFTEPISASHSLSKSHSRIPVSVGRDRFGLGQSQASEMLEAIESVASTARSQASSAPRLDLSLSREPLPPAAVASPPATGIPESDSESERVNSHRTQSRPSSERSTGSTTNSDMRDFEEEDDIISSGSDRTPVKSSLPSVRDKIGAVKMEEDLSEHISVSLPSISERKSGSQAVQQLSLHDDIAELCGEEATPTASPRPTSPQIYTEENVEDPLMRTDPLADFHEGDRVVVTGHQHGTLRFKGTVHFAPGFWAGVELDSSEGNTDGLKEGRRYFTCSAQHGLLVPGSDITPLEEDEVGGLVKGEVDGASNLDESIEELSSATQRSDLSCREQPQDWAPAQQEEMVMLEESVSPEKEVVSPSGRHNLALLADDITDDLTRSLMEDSLLTINGIATRLSPKKAVTSPTLPIPDKSPPATLLKPEKSPPATLPKPERSPPPTLPKPEKSPPPTLPKPEKSPPVTLPKPEKSPPATLPKPETPPATLFRPEQSLPATLPKPEKSPPATLKPEMSQPATFPKPEKSPPETLKPEKSVPSTLPKPEKSPPATLPKPETSPPDILPKTASIENRVPTVVPNASLNEEQPTVTEKEAQNKGKQTNNRTIEKAALSMEDLLLDDIGKIIKMHRSRHDDSGVEHSGQNSTLEQPPSPNKSRPALNGQMSLSDNDSGVDPSHDSSLDQALGTSPEPGDSEELRRPMSPEPFCRPKSPVPGNSPLQEHDDYDFTGLGEDQDFYEDDDYGLSAKPPPPYPGAGDQGLVRTAAVGMSSPVPLVVRQQQPANLFIIPHQRKEVSTIVAEAVDIFWNLRRCGEPWEAAAAPDVYLQNDHSQGSNGEEVSSLVTSTRRTFRRLIFELTGEIVRDIYAIENDTEPPPPWQKPPLKRQRYYKAQAPPSTVDVLLPVVQSAVSDVLGMNGCTGRYRGRSANKWSVRKKKDHVDSVLTEELREEEAEWVTYDADELKVKMQLTETLYESLLTDTVAAVNKAYSKKQQQGLLTS